MPAPTPGTRELACLLLSLSLSNAVAAAPPAAVPVPATAAQHAEPAHATLPTPDATREYDWLTVGEPSGSQTAERRGDGTARWRFLPFE